jgi:hypothetical protein
MLDTISIQTITYCQERGSSSIFDDETFQRTIEGSKRELEGVRKETRGEGGGERGKRGRG